MQLSTSQALVKTYGTPGVSSFPNPIESCQRPGVTHKIPTKITCEIPSSSNIRLPLKETYETWSNIFNLKWQNFPEPKFKGTRLYGFGSWQGSYSYTLRSVIYCYAKEKPLFFHYFRNSVCFYVKNYSQESSIFGSRDLGKKSAKCTYWVLHHCFWWDASQDGSWRHCTGTHSLFHPGSRFFG